MKNFDALNIANHWDAGESGCGQLIVGLKRQISHIDSGALLEVTAHGAGASADLPAWCRVTGHTLLVAEHPRYVFRKKES